ncbi:MAG: hypothetical protein ABSD20_09980 [Terriglobales bacterium]|jgi:hypothetical protein
MLANDDSDQEQALIEGCGRRLTWRPQSSRLISTAMVLIGVLAFAPVAGLQSFADTPSTSCDPGLWFHVYHAGFPTAKDRLKVIESCKTVTGILHFVDYDADGNTHLRLDPDPQFRDLLNDRNGAEGNMLVVVSMCDKKPTQKNAVAEGVCTNWHQHLYKSDMNNKHVSVTGAYIEDQEHGWREIHPVTSITVIP